MTISRRQFGLGAAAAVLAVPLIDRMGNRSADAAEPAAAATVTTYPTPSYFNESSSYSLKVESDEIDVVKNFGYSWARFSYSGTAEFTVTAKEDIDSYDISPHSYGVKATTNGRDLTFSLSQEESRYLVIKINGLENLAITADPLETGRPSPNGREVKSINDYSGVDNTGGKLMTSIIQDAIDDANARDGGGTVYFPNGVYKFSQIELKSDVTLYLAAGAVLRGSEKLSDYDWTGDHFRAANIRIDGASDVAITGRGIIDSNGSALTSGDSGPNRENIVSSYKGSNGSKPKGLTFEGITLRDGTTWNFNLQSSTDVKIHNVKIFNNDTWIHGDGFDLVTTSHAVVDQCFAYTGDDAFCAKGSADDTMTDVVFQNSVAYTRSAGAKVGMQGASDISDIWFKNIDVIQGYRGVSVDHDQGSGSWTDLHFIDIRTQKIYDNGTQGQFRTAPILIWTEEKDGVGPVSKVELTRCSFEDIEDFHSIIQGHDESSRVTDVTITDLTVNGELIEKASDALIDIKEHTSDITFATS
ncbi:glycosyl hydrolase family 28 protein [Streptomyces sp. DT9]